MNHPAIILLRFAWKYAKGHRPTFVLFLALSILSTVILLLEPMVVGKMFNVIQQGGEPDVLFRKILFFLILIFVIPFGFWVFHGISRVLERKTAFHIHVNFKKNLLNQAFSLPLSWHRSHHSGEIINQVNRAATALFDFSQSLFEPVQSATRLIGAYIALTLVMPFAGLATVAVSVIAIGSVIIYDRFLIKQYQEIYKLENRAAATVHDFLSNIVTVISMRLEKIGIREVVRKMLIIFPIFRKNTVLNEVKWFSVSAAIAVMTLVILGGYVIFSLRAGTPLLVGTLYMLYAYLERVADAFYNFAWQYGQIVERATSVRVSEAITKAYAEHEKPKAYPLPQQWKTLELRHMYFTHIDEKKRRHHVEDLHLKMSRGDKIALIGSSGGGKSTVMSLIRGIHSAARAELLVDGKKMPHGLLHLNQYTSLIPQEPEIFAETIRYNITMGKPISDTWLKKAIAMSQFGPVIKKCEKGLLSIIGEKGVNLSGGEKQRLALARGLLATRDKSVLLLDEPTSSVDTKNELLIYENIFREFREKSVIASIHRLHLLRMFDYIYLLDNGKIIEEGSFRQMLAHNGVFRKLWDTYSKTHKNIDLQ